ncbi:MAG: amidohydrolase family protein [Acidobacteria bacterium]|nr:amidohydrolase family protein [Acidobacteriota bacterium]
MVIDTHAHIYSPDEKKYPVIEKPLRPPAGKGSLEHLRQEMAANGVEGACLIQVSTFYRFDNRYICDSAAANPKWTAGVCTLDPDDPHSPGLLKHYAEKYGLRGMRSIPAKNGRLDHPGVRALWKAATEAGIVINVLIGHEKAAELETMLAAFRTLAVVLDHCMNIKAGAGMQTVLDKVVRLARFRNLNAKLTFLPTGSAGGYPCADMHAACLKVIEAYGSSRCVWGSDFPCELWTPKVSYAEHLRIFQKDLPLKDADRAQILGGTAQKLWFTRK